MHDYSKLLHHNLTFYFRSFFKLHVIHLSAYYYYYSLCLILIIYYSGSIHHLFPLIALYYSLIQCYIILLAQASGSACNYFVVI